MQSINMHRYPPPSDHFRGVAQLTALIASGKIRLACAYLFVCYGESEKTNGCSAIKRVPAVSRAPAH